MPKKDAILVLAHTLVDGRVPGSRAISEETGKRVEGAVDLFAKDEANFLLMQGGPGVIVHGGEWGSRQAGDVSAEWVPLGSRPVISDLMKIYAQHLGVPDNRIYTQGHSCDNVGEAVFAGGLILTPLGWKDNFVVTSQYNVKRAQAVYNHILGPDFTTTVIGVLSDKENNEKIVETEENNLNMFIEQFGNNTPGDLEKMLATLYEKHGYYTCIPEKYRVRFPKK